MDNFHRKQDYQSQRGGGYATDQFALSMILEKELACVAHSIPQPYISEF